VKKAGIKELVYLVPAETQGVKALDGRFSHVGWASISVTELESHKFWTS